MPRVLSLFYGFQWSRTSRYLGIILTVLILLTIFFVRLPNVARTAAYNVFREGLKQKALWTTRHMETLQGQHFIVRYTGNNRSDAELVLATAERFYAPVASKYGYSGKGKIPVIVYPSRSELNRNFGWPADESAMGVYWAGVIRVLSPDIWVGESNSALYKEAFETDGPMAHEFTHLVVDYITGGNYTRWLTEGLAQYEEYQLTGFEFDETGALLGQTLYPLGEMDLNFDRLPNQALAYRQSYLAVRYIAEVYGEESLRSLLQLLAEGKKTDKAVTSLLGMDMPTFEAAYQKWAMEKESLNQL